MKFLHCADLHLGHGRSDLRREDLMRAWRWVLRIAREEEVDLVVIAGDLFDRVTPSPRVFQDVLISIQGCLCPVSIAPGNHDRLDDGNGWTAVLARLAAGPDEDLAVWSWSWSGSGSEVAIAAGGGGTLESQIRGIADFLANHPAAFRIAVLHVGLAPAMSLDRGGIDPAILEPLKGIADYVALGHNHTSGSYAGWAYWPGSPEWISVAQYQEVGGVLLVEIIREGGRWSKSVQHIPYPDRRPLRRIDLDVSLLSSPGALLDVIRARAPGASGAVLDLRLGGLSPWRRSELDLRVLEAAALAAGVVEVIVRDLTVEQEAPVIAQEGSPDELRMQAYRDLYSRDPRWADISGIMADRTAEIETLALQGVSAGQIETCLDWEEVDDARR